MAQIDLAHATATTIAQLSDDVRTATESQHILEQLFSRLNEAGLAIDRSAVFVKTSIRMPW
jgi:hypothetical protein